MVFDESLRLNPAPRASSNKPRYAPDYDPDTTDLFGDHPGGIDKAMTGELRHNAHTFIDNLVNEHTAEIEQRLREELTAQLVGIIEALNYQENSAKQ